jgi:hypothetical protein
MKRVLSVKYGAGAFSFSMLLLRVVFGLLLIIKHGFFKLENFSAIQDNFYNFLGLGMKTSLVLSIFAEVLCSLFVCSRPVYALCCHSFNYNHACCDIWSKHRQALIGIGACFIISWGLYHAVILWPGKNQC